MKDYEKLLNQIKNIEEEYFVLRYNLKTEAQVAGKKIYDRRFDSVLDAIRALRDDIKVLVDDQEKEIESMTQEWKQIEKLNNKLGELLDDK